MSESKKLCDTCESLLMEEDNIFFCSEPKSDLYMKSIRPHRKACRHHEETGSIRDFIKEMKGEPNPMDAVREKALYDRRMAGDWS